MFSIILNVSGCTKIVKEVEVEYVYIAPDYSMLQKWSIPKVMGDTVYDLGNSYIMCSHYLRQCNAQTDAIRELVE